ncbi:MAG: imidazolonepropionase-like amidohydrolase [Paraglaciecola sp.]|jgi:imidazolonepropionase-like amidohydrolase
MKLLHSLITTSMLVFFVSACTPTPTEPSLPKADPALQLPVLKGKENFTMLISGVDVGGMSVTHSDGRIVVDFEYRNNGRGPTIKENIVLGADGIPQIWTIKGATTFGSKVDETFEIDGIEAKWTDTTGTGSVEVKTPPLYVAQNPSPYALWLYARVLLVDADQARSVLPGGELKLQKIEELNITGKIGTETVTSYALSGIGMNPSYFLNDSKGGFVGMITPEVALLKEGYETDEAILRERAAEYSARRFEDIQKEVARNFNGPVRIKNIRIFDPKILSLTALVSVVFEGKKIIAIDDANTTAKAEAVIDGAGGTLIAGLYEMHGHLSQNSALLNVAAGITTVRDMGNDDDVLAELNNKIVSGRLVGPRIIRSGFIEGKSPFSSNSGILVSTEEEAVQAVKSYGDGDFHQIKIYNSMKGEWVPAMVEEARKNGLRVTGHVPAFSTANQMIEAGYDELTHINQVVLGWVLEKDEDPRTLLRVTAMKRLQDLDMDDPRINETITAMLENNVAIDPTLAIFELFFNGRNGVPNPAMADFVANMPVSEQRRSKTAFLEIATPEDDVAYKIAYEKLLKIVAKMHSAGIQLVPGTDLGGAFFHHRELELYQNVGMSAAEVLAWGTQGMADYVGQGDKSGSITPGKFADFFLIPGDPTKNFKAIKSISMVVKDGTVYFPSDIYPAFGIKPFADAPQIVQRQE